MQKKVISFILLLAPITFQFEAQNSQAQSVQRKDQIQKQVTHGASAKKQPTTSAPQEYAPLNENFKGYRPWIEYPRWMGHKKLTVAERENLIMMYNENVDRKYAAAIMKMSNDYSGQSFVDMVLPLAGAIKPNSQVKLSEKQKKDNVRLISEGQNPRLANEREDQELDTPASGPEGTLPISKDQHSNRIRWKEFSDYYDEASDPMVEAYENYFRKFAKKKDIKLTPENSAGSFKVPQGAEAARGWIKNQEIIRREMLSRSAKGSSMNSSAPVASNADVTKAGGELKSASVKPPTPAQSPFDPSSLKSEETARGGRNHNKQSATSKIDPTISSESGKGLVKHKPLAPNFTFDPSLLTPEERKGWERNQALNKPGASSKIDPIWLDRWREQGDRVFDSAPAMKDIFYKTYPQLNQPKYREPALYRSPAGEVEEAIANGTLSLNRSEDGSSFDPASLTPEEREGWERNQALNRPRTVGRPNQGSSATSAGSEQLPRLDNVYIDPSGLSPQARAGSSGISFGDMTTRTAPDGLKAVPHVKGDLRMDAPVRYFDKTWTVSNGDKVIAKGFADVQLLGGGLFAAKTNPWGAYKLYSDITGQPISNTEFIQAQSLGGGFVAIRKDGESTWQIKDSSGQTVNTFDTGIGGASATYIGEGKVRLDYVYGGNPRFIDVSKAPSLSKPQSTPPAAAVPSAAVVPSAAPATGGIYIGGQKTYVEDKNLDAEFDKELENGIVIPKKRKKQ